LVNLFWIEPAMPLEEIAKSPVLVLFLLGQDAKFDRVERHAH